MSMGNSSRRPASISKDKTSLENHENPAKFDAGPTSPRPGPILFIVAVMAVKLVIKSLLSNDIAIRDAAKIST